MDGNVEQNLETEEGAAPKVRSKRHRQVDLVAHVVGHEKDRGEWKFRPWNGVDHWVHERTGASSFDLKKNK